MDYETRSSDVDSVFERVLQLSHDNIQLGEKSFEWDGWDPTYLDMRTKQQQITETQHEIILLLEKKITQQTNEYDEQITQLSAQMADLSQEFLVEEPLSSQEEIVENQRDANNSEL